jgi:transaldolase/glucose-6-phosphate isomerase
MSSFEHEAQYGGEAAGGGVRESYALGDYEPAVRDRLQEWTAGGAARRIWNKDFTFWSPVEVPEIADRLGWLRLPETMQDEIDDIAAFAEKVRSEEIEHIVLLGMGGSSLAPQVYRDVFGNRPGHPRLVVLDSTHPLAVRAVEQHIDIRATLFIVASKSGTTVEPLSLLKHFYYSMPTTAAESGARFTAITDPGTPLDDLAREREFRRVFHAVPDVGGRYSALGHFGLVPAALIGVDIGDYLTGAARMAAACRSPEPADANPGLLLGACLGEIALAGRDKLTFVTSPRLHAFSEWLEQLIAESTGKEGKGIIPVVGESATAPDGYQADRLFVHISFGDDDSLVEDRLRGLVSEGHPVIRFRLREENDLAAEMFRWEVATAAACSVLGVHPFNQPDVEKAKSLAREVMSGEREGATDAAGTIPVERGEQLARTLKEALGSRNRRDYLSLQAYTARSPEVEAAVRRLGASLSERYGMATTIGFGPRFLHSTGQLHKGGPDTGIFIQMLDEPAEDMKVPETGFTFGRLICAQALGDYRALCLKNRRVIRVNLGRDAAQGIERLGALIESVN